MGNGNNSTICFYLKKGLDHHIRNAIAKHLKILTRIDRPNLHRPTGEKKTKLFFNND